LAVLNNEKCDTNWKEWEIKKQKLDTNREYWIKKIERNIQRDCEVNHKLTDEGWSVLRFLGNDILKHPDLCSHEIKNIIDEKKIRKVQSEQTQIKQVN